MTPISLEKLPKSSDIPVWGDYIELLCLVNRDNIVTKADVLDRKRDETDSELPTYDEDETIAETRDKEEQQVDDWFRHLIYRQGTFDRSGFYPFYVTNGGDSLKLKDNLTLQHKLYIFLLLASNLRYVPNYKHSITTAFETVSQNALRSILPTNAEVHVFGTSSQGKGRYSGNLLNKIRVLAEDLSERVLIDENTFSSHNSGDKGLDIVGWVPAGDRGVGGLLCVFAQCACTEEWVTKQHSSKVDSWRPVMTFTSPPSNLIFIPFCFRNSNGGWWQPTDIHESIVVDRVRMVHFVKDDYRVLQDLPVYSDIETILAYRESLV
jgi:hypothetical protein